MIGAFSGTMFPFYVTIFLVLNLFQDPETSSGLERIFTATGAKLERMVLFWTRIRNSNYQVLKETIQIDF
jgi:hypothetical protein